MKTFRKMHKWSSMLLVTAMMLALMPATPASADDITPAALPDGETGVPYSEALAATGGNEPYTWEALPVFGLPGFPFASSESPLNLPKGLILTTAGVIEGTPLITGTFDFNVQVTDANDATDNQTFSITINEGPNSVPSTNGEAYYDVAAPGGTVTTRWIFGGPTPPAGTPAFAFEMEFPMSSLKLLPTWNELMQMLDNPYLISLDPATPGTPQGFPSYRADIQRRPSFGVALPRLIVHPLNYNTITGQEMRLLNINFPETNWFRRPGDNITVSAGAVRIEADEAAVDYNSPISSEIVPLNPLQTAYVGGDPGEPGITDYWDPIAGVRVGAINPLGYSLPGFQVDPLDGQWRLYDAARGFIYARDPVTGYGIDPTTGLGDPAFATLRKPTLGKVEITPGNWVVDYLINSPEELEEAALDAGDEPEDAPAYLTASNENDYIKDRNAAIALGKALFWDMQVGSDGVQSCGSCHFAAGADDRTKNQINPNHTGPDGFASTFDLRQPNQDVVRSDFPLHKLADPEIAGDPLASPPLVATINAGILENIPEGATINLDGSISVVVADADNIISDSDDVVSSMGVKFGKFLDIPTPLGPSAFGAPQNGVKALLPDLRSATAADNVDPIAGFAGTDGSGHEIRRVEPRNTPTLFASALNFDNFWDGRARHDFNGGSVFGASDPQSHVFVDPEGNVTGNLTATRQLIRYSSLASLATGPGLSEFEMSFAGRNWAKIGKKLLQTGVTPLANQLVDPTDSVLGPYSNQRSIVGGPVNRPGRPGLNVSYNTLIQAAFYPQLWSNRTTHLDGTPAPATSSLNGVVTPDGADPFDGYVLTVAPTPAQPNNTNQFTQMEGNFSLFWGLSIQAWGQMLIPDNTPLDQFLDANPDANFAIGEPGEPGLVSPQAITEVLNFKRDNDLPLDPTTPTAGTKLTAASLPGDTVLTVNSTAGFPTPAGSLFVLGEANPVTYTGTTPTTFTGIPASGAGSLTKSHQVGNAQVPSTQIAYFAPGPGVFGTRLPSDPDPLRGFDLFFGSNLSLKNANFRSARCGECHLGSTLTDNTIDASVQITRIDLINEFVAPGVELAIEPLSRPRVISGFQLEGEVNENAQDTLERNIMNQSIVPNQLNGMSYPSGSTFIDNGLYNIGVTPIENDASRGGRDAFGWPLSIATLMFKNLGGVDFEPGFPLPTFNPALGPLGGLYEDTTQDQQINPGQEEVANPLLPPHLAPWIEVIPAGEGHPNADEITMAPNTLTEEAMLEGYGDALGPFNAAGVLAEVYNNNEDASMGTWPSVNRVLSNSFKAPQLRNVELTGPYFHNGGKLTLRQQLDFYTRGGDLPLTNAAHRDMLIMNLRLDVQANLTEEEETALIDFLLELTDERVRLEQAPFDRPEVFVPLDGRAPENNFGRAGFLANLANGMFRQVTAVGAAGHPATPLLPFLGISRVPVADPIPFGSPGYAPNDHYDH